MPGERCAVRRLRSSASFCFSTLLAGRFADHAVRMLPAPLCFSLEKIGHITRSALFRGTKTSGLLAINSAWGRKSSWSMRSSRFWRCVTAGLQKIAATRGLIRAMALFSKTHCKTGRSTITLPKIFCRNGRSRFTMSCTGSFRQCGRYDRRFRTLGNAQSGNPASKILKPDGARPTLLYISPVVPLLTGNGLAMRAGTVLELLAEWYSVSLLVVKLYPPFDAAIPEAFRNISERTAIMNPRERSRWSTLPFINALSPASRYRRLRFDVVHVFRLASVPHAREFLEASNSPAAHLDLDDIESMTHTQVAQLCRKNGDDLLGRFAEWQSHRCHAAEEKAFHTFDRVYICSENDREKLKNRAGAQLRILPNIVRLPNPPSAESGANLLFLGTLSYYPNDDAACYLCREIVPRLNTRSSTEFRVNIVGPGASDRLMKAATRDGVGSVVSLRGSVADIEPWYRDALIVVVPVRAGGGTRIKILEAFSYLTPVVTTSAGIEGIDARHGEHVLIADTPDEFAHHCSRLMEDSALRRRLTANAWKLLNERYSIEALKRTSDALLPPEPRKESRSRTGSQLPR